MILEEFGTHAEKLEAGFTKLWFGVYDHHDLPIKKVPAKITIPLGTMKNEELWPNEIMVIRGYNDTLKITNEDDTVHSITADYNEFSSKGVIEPNQTQSISLSLAPGEYGYYSKPWLTGTLTVLES